MKQERFERFKKAMNDIGVTGMTVTQVLGCGTQKGAPEYYRGVPMDIQLLPKTQVDGNIISSCNGCYQCYKKGSLYRSYR